MKEIDEALEEVSSEVVGGYSYKYGTNTAGNKTVDFDIQVYTEDKTNIDSGIGINVAGLKIGANGELNNLNNNLSKLNFSIVREHIKKEQKIKKVDYDSFR